MAKHFLFSKSWGVCILSVVYCWHIGFSLVFPVNFKGSQFHLKLPDGSIAV